MSADAVQPGVIGEKTMSEEDDEFTSREQLQEIEPLDDEEDETPEEVRGWNWGAFFLNWIWGLGNRTYIALAMFIPGVNLLVPFLLGFMGNKWAWQNKEWEDVDDFLASQRRWAIAGTCVFLLMIFGSIGGAFWHQKFLAKSEPFRQSVAQITQHDETLREVGGKIRPGWYVLGDLQPFVAQKDAWLKYPVNTPKGEVVIETRAVMEKSGWDLSELSVTLSNGKTIRPDLPRDIIKNAKADGRAALENGDGESAVAALTIAAKLGDAAAPFMIGDIYATGDGVDVDLDLAEEWMKKAVKAGNPGARARLAEIEEMLPPDPTPEQLKEIAEAEALEDVDARFAAAEQAMADLRKLAEGGSIAAQIRLADILFNGQGVGQNFSLAAMWYRKAAEAGDADAQYVLGSMYVRGEAVPRSMIDARDWLTKAAEQGHEGAKQELRTVGSLAALEEEADNR